MIDIDKKINKNEIKCPYCNYTNEECNFPDLFYEGCPNLKEQYKLLQGLWTLGYNIVTCGECGQVIIVKIKEQ